MKILQGAAMPASTTLRPVAGAPVTTTATDATAASFAALLAGALAPHVAPPSASDASAPTSELDAKELSDGATTKDEAAVNPAATDTPTTGSDVSLAVLGAAAAGLDTTLQARLARVITRMKSEFGRDVQVAEGVRSQQRQNQLFAQGRSTTGPIVTWTRNSHHIAGRAADLVIDGGYDDSAGFSLLRKVAEQEGLHTLGAKDPGHVEMRGSARVVTPVTAQGQSQSLDLKLPDKGASGARAAEAMAEPRVNAIVNAIGVARVASVARVATVARVAGASVSAPDGAKTTTANTPSAPTSSGPGANGSSNGSSSGSNRSSNDDSGSSSDGARTRDRRSTIASHVEGGVNVRSGEDTYRALDRTRMSGGPDEMTATDTLGNASSLTAARTVRAMDAQDAPGPRTLSRLMLSLDDGQGGQDQVRVGMRGNAVGASFEMRDANSAERVSARLGELTRALEQRGLEPQAFQVRAAPMARDADTSRAASLANESQRTVADTSAMRRDTGSEAGNESRHRNAQQDDQQERAQRRQAEQRRHAASFSLTSEES